jgi:hypothetical protein
LNEETKEARGGRRKRRRVEAGEKNERKEGTTTSKQSAIDHEEYEVWGAVDGGW